MKRPLVFYAISTALGCLSTLTFYDNAILGAVIAASFFVILLFTLDIRFVAINCIFFILGIFSFNIYFNINITNPTEVRVIDKRNYYYIGEFKGRKILITGKVYKLEEGDKIKVYGSFKRERDVSRGIVGNYKVDRYQLSDKDFVYHIYKFKKNMHQRFKAVIGEERSALVMALCYGDTHYLSNSQKQEFQKLGVVHAVSVSGFHMAIIYKVLEILVGLKIAILISTLYMFFTGLQAATVRSFIMILIFKLSKSFFKEYDSISSLSLAALILMIAKPYYIVDIGFGLSFLATLGIILYYKKFLKIMYKFPQKLSESMSITLSSQVFSMPYIAFTIQNFSYGFILGNLFLLPMYSAIVVLGNAALVFSFLNPIFKLTSILINFILTAVEGANLLILKVCPSIMYLGYIDGLFIIIIFMSFLLYKKGYNKIKYFPLILLIAVFFQSYSIFTSVKLINWKGGEAIIINKGIKRVMVCNYDCIYSSWVVDLRDKMAVDKIITNPEKPFDYKVDKDLYIKVRPEIHSFMQVELNDRNKGFNFFIDRGSDKAIGAFNNRNSVYIPKVKSKEDYYFGKYENCLEKSNSYVIIFNRLIRVE